MKKLLITAISMNVGGVEKSLLNFLAKFNHEEYDIKILFLENFGGFFEQLPSWIKVDFLPYYSEIKKLVNEPPRNNIAQMLRSRRIYFAAKLFFHWILRKISGSAENYYNFILKKYPNYAGSYDAVIQYAGPMEFLDYFVSKKVTAKRKILWIHFDPKKIGFSRAFSKVIFQNFHKIYTVSHQSRENLLEIIPEVSEKTEVFHNTISRETIQDMSIQGEDFTDQFQGLRILTVGRLSSEKGQDIAIRTILNLKRDGLNVRWYCVGDGNARKSYESMINQFGLEDDFILLGMKLNPYPYMRNCDIYVQPSRHEGYCITLAEAKVFCKPIVSTDFTGAREQLIHGKTGVIVELEDENNLYLALKELIQNSEKRELFSLALSEEVSSVSNDIRKFREIFED